MRPARLRAVLGGPVAVATVLVLPTAFVAGTIFFATGSPWPASPRKPPQAVVVWGDRAFTTRRGFEMWLEANGGDYRRWAKNHPAAAALLSRPPRARRAAVRVRASAGVASEIPLERRAYFALLGLAGGLAAFVSVAFVRRLGRVSIPAVALAGYTTNVGRVGATRPRASSVVPRRPRRRVTLAHPPAARARRLFSGVRRLHGPSVPARAEEALSAFRRLERFDLVFGALAISAGLAVGIAIPVILA